MASRSSLPPLHPEGGPGPRPNRTPASRPAPASAAAPAIAFTPDIALSPLDPVDSGSGYRSDPFRRDRFLLKQRALTISQKYDVCDEAGNKIIFVHRPAFVFRSLVAVFAAIFTFLLIAGGLMAAAAGIAGNDKSLEWLMALGAFLGLFGGIVGAMVVAVALSPRRHVTMFRDEGMTESLLHVRQDQKWAVINMRYTVTDTAGTPLAVLRKNYLYDIIRKKWICENPAGGVLCIIREDSFIKAFFRRFVGGVLAALLRTNFIITDESQTRQIGKFDRKFTVLDRYVLDMTADAGRTIDRRVALAIGVMLDTAERR